MLGVADGGGIADSYQADAWLMSQYEGRWISPDPAGLNAVDMTNPQSLNRYPYVMNNPLSTVDPDGTSCHGQLMQTRRVAITASVAGFFMPFFWEAANFIFFGVRESVWTRLFWDAVYVTCPVWSLDGAAGLAGTIAMPFVNALIYGVVCLAIVTGFGFRSKY